MNCWGVRPVASLNLRLSCGETLDASAKRLMLGALIPSLAPVDNGLHFSVPGQSEAVLVLSLHGSHRSDRLALLVHDGELVGQVPSGNSLKVEE